MPPPSEGQRMPPPPLMPNGAAPRTQGNRPLPHTMRETTLPPSLTASLARLAGRDPARAPEPPLDDAPPERKRSGT
ncbi:MAG: hypothetical protein J0J14_15580 [Hyphomicrobium sp.]|uniref:hypothetical protein n=1 Tax=Hyphomicrobium sp. CS1BSMeth3 TaxID=1892844 RepID=UPI001160292C|nr:hypothetical protein [Hyphomicrobium sp. CS1BSMeth3]MBN9262262.1 hypothetical protein [Hyphomicrobium sp.]